MTSGLRILGREATRGPGSGRAEEPLFAKAELFIASQNVREFRRLSIESGDRITGKYAARYLIAIPALRVGR